MAPDDLPLGRTDAVSRLADRIRHGPDGFGGRDDHDGEHEGGHRDTGGDDVLAARGPAEADGVDQRDEQRKAEQAVDDRRHASEVPHRRVHESGEGVAGRILLEVDGGSDADGERQDGDDHGDDHRSDDGRPDAVPGRLVAREAVIAERDVHGSPGAQLGPVPGEGDHLAAGKGHSGRDLARVDLEGDQHVLL